MRHLHASDINFLEAFHDEEFSQATPVNAVAVLSRADEVGVGRIDSMASAQRIAGRYRHDPKVRRLCPDRGARGRPARPVGRHPARGRVQGARRHRLGAPRRRRGPVPVGRPVRAGRDADPAHVDGARAPARPASACSACGSRSRSSGRARPPPPPRCRPSWCARSGLVELRDVLLSQFAQRRDVLKARSALLALESVLARAPGARPRRAGLRARAHHRRAPTSSRRSACSTRCGPAA